MFSPGTLLAGKYELLEVAGQGGMATVWKARMQGAGAYSRPLAIKVMLARLCHDPHFVDLFIEEARVSAQLQHPNVVQITDFGQDSGIYFLAMEWVDGLDLLDYARSFTEQGFLMPWAALATVSVEVLKGLQAAHQHVDERGLPSPIFHRDVTPHNVLLGTSGMVKLTDFGLAKATDRGTMTLPHVLKGKISYTAPEMTRGVKANARTDIFSLGVTFWEALTGRKMFDAGSPLQIVRQIQAWNVPPLMSLRPDLPHDLIDVVEQAIARDPNQRFDSAQAMALALSRLLPPLPDLARLGKSVAQAKERLWQAKNAPVEDFDKMRESLKPMLPAGPTFSAPTADGRAARVQPGAGARTPSSEAPPATPSVRVSRPAPVRISERSPAPVVASTSGSLSVSVVFDDAASAMADMGALATTPPPASTTTPPPASATTPPTGAATTPPRGAPTTPPTGAATTRPRGAPTAPPQGAPTTPPSGAATMPPGVGARPAPTGAVSQRHDALRPPPGHLPSGRAVPMVASSPPSVEGASTPVVPPPRMGSQPDLGTAAPRQGSRPDLGARQPSQPDLSAHAARARAGELSNPPTGQSNRSTPATTGFEDEVTRHGNPPEPGASSGASLSSRLGATRGPFYRPPTPAQGTPAERPSGPPAAATSARTTTATGLGGSPPAATPAARSTTGTGVTAVSAGSARTTTATGLGGTPAPAATTPARSTTATGLGGSMAPTPVTPPVRSTTAPGVNTPPATPSVRSTTATGVNATPAAPSARTTTATGPGGSARTTTAPGPGSMSGSPGPGGGPAAGVAPAAGSARTTTATGLGGPARTTTGTGSTPTPGAVPSSGAATPVPGAVRTTTSGAASAPRGAAGSAPPGSLPPGGVGSQPPSVAGRGSAPASKAPPATMRSRSSRPPEPSRLDISLEFDLGPSSPQWQVPASGDEVAAGSPSGGQGAPASVGPVASPRGPAPSTSGMAPRVSLGAAPAPPRTTAGSSRTTTGGGAGGSTPVPRGATPAGRTPVPPGVGTRAPVTPARAPMPSNPPGDEASSLVEIEDLLGSLPSHKNDK